MSHVRRRCYTAAVAEARVTQSCNGAATVSLVAVDRGAIVGHVMFSPLSVESVVGTGLGPMAVLPSHQRQGIGSRLVEAGIERLRRNGCPFVVVMFMRRSRVPPGALAR